MRTITDGERRARLARRHRFRPGHRAATVEAATDAMVCLHGTEPASVYLSAFARVDGLVVADVDRALYEERTLVKQIAMRRTLFVFGRDLLPIAVAGAGARVAAEQRRLILRDVEKAGLHEDAPAWLAAASAAVLAALDGGRTATMAELREELAVLAGTIAYGEGRTWGGPVPFAPRVLTEMSARGAIVRGPNRGGWRTSRPAWSRPEDWLGAPIPAVDADAALTELVRRWLATFGPGTERDLKWWLGSTLGAVRGALRTLGAVEVALADGRGYVLADDVEPVEPVAPWAALLPVLDPTTMGWQARDWYLGAHRAHLFDAAGNAGTTAWWDGRIVGGWHQDADGDVVVALLEDVGADAKAALGREAARLTDWLGGVRPRTVYASPLMRGTSRGSATLAAKMTEP
jgi:hypothetical protein